MFTALNYTVKAAVSRTVDCSSGYLATLAASYLTYVTNLTVTGTIDARDFKTMRDDMPMLEVIDLSGCRVVAYTGTAGTKGTTTISYPANGIPDYAFRKPDSYSGKASLKTFIYPLLISSIGDFAFYNCSEFVGSLTIPETVTSIGVCSFSECRKINGSINIPSSVITIGNQAFVECSGFIEVDKDNPNYSSLEGVLFDKNKTTLLQCPISKTGNYLIPSTVTNIIFSSFRSCQGFTGTITIPQSVTKIDDETFRTCSGLIAVEQNNPNFSSLDGILYNKDKTILIHCPYSRTGTLTIPSSVIIIGEFAFEKCRHLTGSLTIPSSVTTIEGNAFSGCRGLTGSLIIPSSVITIGDSAFKDCSGFKGSLTIPSSVTTIGDYAFDDCYGFNGSLTISSSVTTIGSWAFTNCRGLTGSLTIPSSVATIGRSAFEGCSGFNGSLTIPSSVTTIGGCAFSGCTGFTGSLIIPSSVTTIGSSAFQGCSGFTGPLVIPSSVTAIDIKSFAYCSGFTGSFSIPSSVTTIGDEAFSGCTGFTGSLTIPTSVTTIGKGAFYFCTGFTGSLIIPSSVTTIGSYAFSNCSGFTGLLTIPSSVTTIGYEAFGNCISLTTIYAYSATPIDISASWFVFWRVNKTTCILHVPVGSKELYKAADQWKDFTNIVDDIVATSADEVVDSQTISTYPNPATSTITISELGSLEGNQNVTISIIDVLGNALIVKEVESSLNSLSIDVSAFKKGIYFINMQTSNGNVVKRFIKE